MFILDTIRQLAKTDRVAAVSKEGALTYAELENNSNELAAFLFERFPGKRPVALWGDKENGLLIAIIAALKSGKSYVMIPNFYPIDRVNQIVKDCEPCCVFSFGTIPWSCVQSNEKKYEIYDYTMMEKIFSGYAICNSNHLSGVQMDDVVCFFYTSGSTGVPKGVAVKRKNIEAMVKWWQPISDSGVTSPRMLNFVPYGFAYSMGPLYNYLGLLGVTLYAVEHTLIGDHNKLMSLILKTDPHYLNCTPSFIEICMQHEHFCSTFMPSMTKIVLGGEPLPSSIARNLFDRFPGICLLNGFGSTETTIGPLSCNITREMASEDMVLPIGSPGNNSTCLVLDEDGKELPEGRTGELIVISDMVVDGYYHDSLKTASAFFTTSDGKIGFRTGDLVRCQNGLFYYVGRRNNMVKIGGYRIEIEEIEALFERLPGIQRCAIAPVMKDERALFLSAYVVLDHGLIGNVKSTIMYKKYLSDQVPHYMVPQRIIYTEKLPKNTNGKIDRSKLLEMSRLH